MSDEKTIGQITQIREAHIRDHPGRDNLRDSGRDAKRRGRPALRHRTKVGGRSRQPVMLNPTAVRLRYIADSAW